MASYGTRETMALLLLVVRSSLLRRVPLRYHALGGGATPRIFQQHAQDARARLGKMHQHRGVVAIVIGDEEHFRRG